MACYADDATNFQVAAGAPRAGKSGIRADLASFLTAFPDSYSKVENIMSDGDWAAWEWLGGGTFLGEFMGQPPTGKPYVLRGCGFFRCENGLIQFQRGYWDKHTWFSQIGFSTSE
jgi:steroid delta-isomerase-like uncharacterized protein